MELHEIGPKFSELTKEIKELKERLTAIEKENEDISDCIVDLLVNGFDDEDEDFYCDGDCDCCECGYEHEDDDDEIIITVAEFNELLHIIHTLDEENEKLKRQLNKKNC